MPTDYRFARFEIYLGKKTLLQVVQPNKLLATQFSARQPLNLFRAHGYAMYMVLPPNLSQMQKVSQAATRGRHMLFTSSTCGTV